MTTTRFLLTILFVITSVVVPAQTAQVLPRSFPRAEGVSSQAILNFLDAASKSKHEFHSLMVLRHGKVIVEGWWKPYGPDLKHTLYSLSKSFTSTAIGFAVAEKRLSVDDKVISFFPEAVPTSPSLNLKALTVRHLLSMSAGQRPDPTFTLTSSNNNWVKTFLALPIVDTPGTKFLYNSMATYMLSAIIEKKTGEKLVDYLTPRLFAPLGISGYDWEVDPYGINTGGWGLRVKTEDIAKLGLLYLQNGQWMGKQLLPQEWIKEATQLQVQTAPEASPNEKQSSDWAQGYGYQFWQSRHQSYRGDGAFGQLMLVLPQLDAVIAVTAETHDMQGQMDLIWKHLLPAFSPTSLPPNPDIQNALTERLATLALPELEVSLNGAAATANNIYQLQPNKLELQSVGFDFTGSVGTLTLQTAEVANKLMFAKTGWTIATTNRHGPNLLTSALANQVGQTPFKTAGTYRFTNTDTLELELRYIEGPHKEYITCMFNGDQLTMEWYNSIQGKKEKTILLGKQKQLENE